MAGYRYPDLRIAVTHSGAAGKNIPCVAQGSYGSGKSCPIEPGDTILFVGEFNTSSSIATLTDRTSVASIQAKGIISVSTLTSSATTLWVWWMKNNSTVEDARAEKYCLRFNILSGANADTDIAVSDITTSDEIIHCAEFVTASSIATMNDVTLKTHITSAGNIQTKASTASNALLLIWRDIAGGTEFHYFNPKFNVLNGTTAATNITVTGATTDDKVLSCLHFETAASIATLSTDLASEGSFTSTNNYQNSTTDTSNDRLLLIWHDVA